MPDLRLGNVFQLPSRRISRRWTRSGTNLVIFLEALCAQTNLFWREMKKMYLKSDTRQENFRTFEERDVLNKIKSDQLPAKRTSLRGIVLPVKIPPKFGTFHTILHPPYQALARPRPTISGPMYNIQIQPGRKSEAPINKYII